MEWYWWIVVAVVSLIGLALVASVLFYIFAMKPVVVKRRNETLLYESARNSDESIKLFGRPLLEIEMMFFGECFLNSEYIGCLVKHDIEKYYSLVETYVDEQYSQKAVILSETERNKIAMKLAEVGIKMASVIFNGKNVVK